MNDAPQFHPKNRAAWRDWLIKHHQNSSGVWLVWHKKHTGKTELSYDDMVEEALCFGWIDSVPRKVDEERTSLYFSPRKPKSEWSALNKERILKLEAAGLLQQAGIAKIVAAKTDGSWDLLNLSDSLTVPPDLITEFSKYPHAAKYFAAFPAGAKKNLLAWIFSAKTDATRQKRIAETARLANENIRANQWQPKS